jgi:hypothetical protein
MKYYNKETAEKIIKDRPHMDQAHMAYAIVAATGERYEKVAQYLTERSRLAAVAKIAGCTIAHATKIIGKPL